MRVFSVMRVVFRMLMSKLFVPGERSVLRPSEPMRGMLFASPKVNVGLTINSAVFGSIVGLPKIGAPAAV